MNFYLDVLKKYAVFEGRAGRQEFWMYVLFNFIISVVLALIGRVIGFPLIVSVYALATLLPSIGVAMRRLHDTNRSGWMLLVGMIPCVGLILIYWYALEGTPGDNQYGPPPTSLPPPASI